MTQCTCPHCLQYEFDMFDHPQQYMSDPSKWDNFFDLLQEEIVCPGCTGRVYVYENDYCYNEKTGGYLHNKSDGNWSSDITFVLIKAEDLRGTRRIYCDTTKFYFVKYWDQELIEPYAWHVYFLRACSAEIWQRFR